MATLRIMTYNVRYFSHGTRGLASTRRSMHGIAQAIATLDPLPDVVCLQEVETASLRANLAHRRDHKDETQLSRLLAFLHRELEAKGASDGYEGFYFPAHAYTLTRATNFFTTGLAILARRDVSVEHHNALSPRDITHRRLQLVRGLKQTRISAHLRIGRAGGPTIDVFNTHLSLPATWTAKFWFSRRRLGYGKNQVAEAQNLADFIDAERASDRFLVVGDFNALPGSTVYRYLTEERGLVDAFRTVRGCDDEGLRKWPTAGFLNLRMHLDHVFTGPGIEWIDFDESDPFGRRGARFHGLSDHVPLIARCRVANGSSR
jgi:endonuclease/exonuclease/phosphatase family metal-dependent hydrolase